MFPYLFGIGPPPVTAREAYARRDGGPAIDHSIYGGLLKAHVDADGYVDYAALKKDEARLDEYLDVLKNAPPPEQLGRDEILALRLNAYNAFTLKLVLERYPIASIKDIPGAERWAAVRWRLGPDTWSLEQLEHEQIRPKFADPRVHWALVCAAVGCPKLRNEAYEGPRVDAQLEDQARYVHAHPRWFRYDARAHAARLTSLYSWYAGDFAQAAGSALAFAARYVPELQARLARGESVAVEYLPYDWALNDLKAKDE